MAASQGFAQPSLSAAYSLAHGRDVGGGNNRNTTAKARARVAKSLQLECDVPPPANARGEQSLDRHLCMRYIPAQVPFSALSCGEYLTARDVEDLVTLFHRYNVLPNNQGLSSNRNTLAELCGQPPDGLPGSTPQPGYADAGGPTNAGVPATAATVAGAAAPAPGVPKAIPSGRTKQARLGSASLSDSKLTRDENDRALSPEWVVELLLNIIASHLDTPVTQSTAATTGFASLPGGRRRRSSSSITVGYNNSGSTGSENDVVGPSQHFVGALGLGETPTAGQRSRRGSLASSILHSPANHFDTASTLAYRTRRRTLRQAKLNRFREELLRWVEPLVQECDAHQHPTVWEECDQQMQLLEEYHTIMLQADLRRGYIATTTGAGAGLNSSLLHWTPDAATVPASAGANYGRDGPASPRCGQPTVGTGPQSPLHSTASSPHRLGGRGNTAVVTVVVPPGIAPGKGSAVPADFVSSLPAVAVPVMVSSRRNSAAPAFAECNSSSEDGPSTFREVTTTTDDAPPQLLLAYHGEHADGTQAAMWRDVLLSPHAWGQQLREYAEEDEEESAAAHFTFGSGATIPPASATPQWKQQAARRRRERCSHHIVCWSDLTNNFIAENNHDLFQRGAETTYVRVPTMTLEEEDKGNHHMRKPEGANSDPGTEDDDEDEEAGDMTHISANRSRRRRNTSSRNKDGVTDPTNSVVADLETFAEELKGLHRHSADHALVTRNSRNIITSSKDGVVKVWETRWGQFVGNLLNVDSAWVLGMYLLHDDQYLLVVTTNAELTILEFPRGTILQKLRGCTSLVTALRNVTQQGTEYVQRYGIKPGECGPHRMRYRDGMPAEVFHTLRKEARLAHTVTVLPAKPIEGFVAPTAFFFHRDLGLCLFGTAEGVVGCFDISQDVKRSTIMSGASSKPIHLAASVQAQRPGIPINGILYSHTGNCIISTGPDGSVVRTPLITDPRVGVVAFGTPLLLPTHTQKPVRSLTYCSSAKVFVTIHSDRRALMWSLGRTGTELIHQYPQETQDIVDVAFMEKHERLALLNADRSIRVYDFRGFRPVSVIYPSRLSENQVEDMASVTLKSSMDDADGALAFIPKSGRIACALRGPVLYEPSSMATNQADASPSASKRASMSRFPSDDGAAASVTDGRASNDMGGDTADDGPGPASEADHQRRGSSSQRVDRRLQRHVTHRRGIVEVVIHRAAAELHTFSAERWKVWSLHTGELLRELEVPRQMRVQLPMFSRTFVTCGSWTTDGQSRLLAGSRDGIVVTLDAAHGAIISAEEVIREGGAKGDLVDRDLSVITHYGTRTYICGGRTCVVRRYTPGIVGANGEERAVSMTVRLPSRTTTTITACCVVRDTHICLGTVDTRLYFFRTVDNSAPYCEEQIRCEPDGEFEIGAVVGLFYLNEQNQNLLLAVLDTGVVHIYSYLRNSFIARLRVVRENECRLRKVVHNRSEHLLAFGDSLGRVCVLDISKFTSEHVDFRRVISTRFSFQAAMDEVVALDFFAATTSPVFAASPTHHQSLPLLSPLKHVGNASVGDNALTSNSAGSATVGQYVRPQQFLVVGSLCGNVRMFVLALSTDHDFTGPSTSVRHHSGTPTKMSSAVPSDIGSSTLTDQPHLSLQKPQKQQQCPSPVAVGLFGIDKWDLIAGESFSDVAIPPLQTTASAAHRRNELFLDTILQQAKNSTAAAEAALPSSPMLGTCGAAAGPLPPTPAPQAQSNHGAGKAWGPAAALTKKADADTLLNPARGADGDTPSPNHHRTSAQRVRTPKPAGGTMVSSVAEGMVVPSSSHGPPLPLTIPTHTMESILQSPTNMMGTIWGDSTATAAGTLAVTDSGAFSSCNTLPALAGSLGPQQSRKESKYRRNPLLKTYPVAWLKRIGVINTHKNIPDVTESGEAMLLPAEVAFAENINDIVLPGELPPVAVEVEDEEDVCSQGGDAEVEAHAAMSTPLAPRRDTSAGAPFFLTSVPPEGSFDETGIATSTSRTSIASAVPELAYSQGARRSLTPLHSPNNSGNNRPPSTASTRQRSSDNGIPTPPQTRTGSATDRGCSPTPLLYLHSRGSSPLAADTTTAGLPYSPNSQLLSGSGIDVGMRSRDTPLLPLPPPILSPNTSSTRVGTAVSWGEMGRPYEGHLGSLTMPSMTPGHLPLSGPLPQLPVLEQRRDQLMLAHLAGQLDRVRPHGHQPDSFTTRLHQSWLKRAGEAAVVAATRAAALSSSSTAAPPPAAALTLTSPTSEMSLSAAHATGSPPTHHLSQPTSLQQSFMALSSARSEEGDASAIGLDLRLLGLPIEVDALNTRDGVLSARERMETQLLTMRKQRQDEASERRQRAELNPNPYNHRYWLPLFSSRQSIHPLHVTLPSTLRSDEGAKVQLRQLQQLCATTTTTTTAASSSSRGSSDPPVEFQGPSKKAEAMAYV